MPHNQQDLTKKRDKLKSELDGIEKLEAAVVEASQELSSEMAAAEKDVEKVYKEEADKLQAAMMEDARSALKE